MSFMLRSTEDVDITVCEVNDGLEITVFNNMESCSIHLSATEAFRVAKAVLNYLETEDEEDKL